MANSISSLLFLIVITNQYTLTASKSTSNNIKSKRLATRLIHRNNIFTTYSNSNDTIEDNVKLVIKTSATRLTYLQARIEREYDISDFQVDIRSTFSTNLFFVNFSIGEPPIPQFTIMDTGSSLLWVQCLPCEKCSQQISSMLDPSKSSTYASLPCENTICLNASNSECNSLNECVYKQRYVKGAESDGVLATEQLIFTSDDKTIVVSSIVFGCGHQNGDHNDNQFTGVLGLGYKPSSLAVQLGSKFSYCIGNINDKDYSHNHLVLGNEAYLEGDSTPIETFSGLYYITLEGISVGEKRLDIDPFTFKRKGPKSGVIIDSGTTLTWLAEDGYKKLHSEVKNLLDKNLLKRFWFKNYLCYIGKVSQELVGFPAVTFHFAGGADLVLETGSLFFQLSTSPHYQDVFCMAVRPITEHGNDYRNFTVIGLMAQQYYNVAYDLDGFKLFFQMIDCELLDDYSDYPL